MVGYVVTPELVTAPVAEPLTTAELKLHLRVDSADDDALIASLGIAARQWLEVALDRQLVTATWKVRLPSFPGGPVELPYPPLQSVSSVVIKDAALATQTVAASVYDVLTNRTPGVVQPKNGQSWPATGVDPLAVTITFVAGYGVAAAVSDLVKAALKLLVGHWYENRQAVAEGAVREIPLAVESIVAATRAYRF